MTDGTAATEPIEPSTLGRGRFIAFEGGEGCGKSTQAALLAERLDAVLTFEPGDTVIGARLRKLLLDPETKNLDGRAEALLMAADRAQHVAEVIRPALDGGRDVVTDRYVGSSIAYQGYGRGLPVDGVRTVSAFAHDGLEPDVVVFLRLPHEDAQARLGSSPDRMEAAGNDFHERVLAGYEAQAVDEPDRWVTIDGAGSIEEVAEAVLHAVVERTSQVVV
jgi:dTMP kinase